MFKRQGKKEEESVATRVFDLFWFEIYDWGFQEPTSLLKLRQYN